MRTGLFAWAFVAALTQSPCYAAEELLEGRILKEKCSVLDWMHLKVMPSFPSDQSKCLLILADEITISENSRNEYRTGSIYIVANKLIVNTEFSLNAFSDKFKSPEITVVARKLILGPSGTFRLKSIGRPGSLITLHVIDEFIAETPTQELSSKIREYVVNSKAERKDLLTVPGNSLIDTLYYDKVDNSSGVANYIRGMTRFRAAKGGRVWMEATEENAPSSEINRGLQQQNYTILSTLTTDPETFDRIANSLPEGSTALSLWSVKRLQSILSRLRSADLSADRSTQLEIIKGIQSFSKTQFAIAGNHAELYSRLSGEISSLKTKLVPLVFKETMFLTMNEVQISVIKFVNGPTFAAYVAPTISLVKTRSVNGRSVLGLVSAVAGYEDRLQLNFDVDLLVDAAVAAEAEKLIVDEGQSFGGSFSNWTLSNFELFGQGILGSTITKSGNTLQVTLILSAKEGNVALWRLWNQTGLGLQFDYFANDDASVRGTFTIPISFTRRNSRDLKVTDSTMHFTGNEKISIDYVKVGKKIVFFKDEVSMDASTKSLEISLPFERAVGQTLTVPSEAIRYSGSDFSWDMFETSTNATGLIQQVRVQNLFPAVDVKTGMQQDFVEFRVIHKSGISRTELGPFKISPRGTTGSEINLSFMKNPGVQSSVEVQGTVFYDGQRSRKNFRYGPSSDILLKISPEILYIDKP